MSNIEDVYIALYNKLKELTMSWEKAERQLQEVSAGNQAAFQKLEAETAAELREVADRMGRVNVFVNFAREHTRHCEVAERAERYDTAVLNQLMALINDRASEDGNARSLYTRATGQLKGLAARKTVLQKKADERRVSLRMELQPVRDAALREKEKVHEAFHAFFASAHCLDALRGQMTPSNAVNIGFRQAAFPIPEGQQELALAMLGGLWDKRTKSIALPVIVRLDEGSVCIAEYENATEDAVLSGMRAVLLKGISISNGDSQNICFFDPIRYNDSVLGILEPLANGESSLIDKTPTSKEEARRKLDAIIGRIQTEDQIAAKNEQYNRPAKCYVFHNFPQGYDSAMQERVRQVCVNASHGKVNVFLTHNCSEDGTYAAKNEAYTYIKTFGKIIGSREGGFYTDWDKNGDAAPFGWNRGSERVPEELLAWVRTKREKKNCLGNDYDERVGLQTLPVYKKGVRRLTDIPYGVDESGRLLTLDFENSNFATFICGAARSGKSTLLHTILTGIFLQNHPDDVEVWLIDFKMTEFSRYIRHMPPHVRYIILDESPELVYDIINRLSEILQKRQNIFKGAWQKLYDVPKEKYMPAMFVVIDEFSIMSQIIADSVGSGGNYAEKLQALLAKGAALGMHFIFASQGFTSGTRGLNDFSKKQVQQRIAMKTELAEIKATLDLTSASQQDYAMMEQLAVHRTLIRIPVDEFGNHLCLADVLFISDYKKQESLIDRINEGVFPKPRYDVNDIHAYIHKQPMVIDGNSYHLFSEKRDEITAHLRRNECLMAEEDIFAVFLGEPRRMMSVYPVQMADSYGENIFMLAPVQEKEAVMSVLLSLKKSLDMQRKPVELWTAKKQGIYQQLIGRCGWRTKKSLDLEEVCQAIHACKEAIERKEKGDRFIVLLGFESLMMDMSFQEKGGTAGFSGRGDSKQTMGAADFQMEFKPLEKRTSEGDDLLTQLRKQQEGSYAQSSGFLKGQPDSFSAFQAAPKPEEPKLCLYDARDDLRYILTQGPRLGYHFLLLANTMGEYKQMQFSHNLFKHKVLFRASKDEIYDMAGSQGRVVAALADHSFRYTNGLDSMNFRPFLHEGLSLDGWQIGEDGTVEEEAAEEENYLL